MEIVSMTSNFIKLYIFCIYICFLSIAPYLLLMAQLDMMVVFCHSQSLFVHWNKFTWGLFSTDKFYLIMLKYVY